MTATAAAIDPAAAEVVQIPIEALAPDPVQPRRHFTEKSLHELAASMEQHGILQPLLVRPVSGAGGAGKYWIVGGERRYRAALLLGWRTLPCRIRAYVNTAAAVVALAENVHREDLDELEKAEALLRIKTMTEKTWDQVAELVKLSRDYVKRLAGLLKLEESVKELVRTGRIPARTAIALKPLPPGQQVEMAERVLRDGLSAEQVREAVRLAPLGRRAAALPRALDLPTTEALADLAERSPGAVVAALRECRNAVGRIEGWLDGRSWTPSRVSEEQERALDDLYQQVSLLQQRLIAIRRPLREAEPDSAELLRAAKLPF